MSSSNTQAEHTLTQPSFDKTVYDIHFPPLGSEPKPKPKIQPFPPAGMQTLSSNIRPRQKYDGRNRRGGRKQQPRSSGDKSNLTTEPAPLPGSLASVPCSECGRYGHQRVGCFFAYRSNLEKFLEKFPGQTAFWERRLEEHKAKKAKDAEEAASRHGFSGGSKGNTYGLV